MHLVAAEELYVLDDEPSEATLEVLDDPPKPPSICGEGTALERDAGRAERSRKLARTHGFAWPRHVAHLARAG